MTEKQLEYYANRLRIIRLSGGTTPHKPVLLLTIIDAIESLQLKENLIPLNQEIEALFKQNWSRFTQNNIPQI